MTVTYSFASVGACRSTGKNVQLFYEEFTPSQKEGSRLTPPVVLLMANIALPGAIWSDALCQALCGAGYRVIRYDQRDTGRSTHFDECISPTASASEPPCAEAVSSSPSNHEEDDIIGLFATRASSPRQTRPSRPRQLRDVVLHAALSRLHLHDPLYYLEDLARDVIGLLNHLRAPNAHLVGVTMGAMVAQVVALHYPKRVASLALISSHHHGPHFIMPSTTFILRIMRCMPLPFPKWFPPPPLDEGKSIYTASQEARLRQHAQFTVHSLRVIEGPRVRVDEKAVAYAMNILRRTGPLDYQGSCRHAAALLAAESRQEALREKITSRLEDSMQSGKARSDGSAPQFVPCVIINGKKDPLSPFENAQSLAEAIPGSRLRSVETPELLGMCLKRELHAILVEEVARNVRLYQKARANISHL